MCTVTYLPLPNNNFILTSNRDETPLRKTIPPKTYIENDAELTYPYRTFYNCVSRLESSIRNL